MGYNQNKQKGPGDNVILRFKKDEKSTVIDWVNGQSQISESLRFLIEADVQRNGGIVDYGKIIPPHRDKEFLVNFLKQELLKQEMIGNVDNNIETQMNSNNRFQENSDVVSLTNTLNEIEPKNNGISEKEPSFYEVPADSLKEIAVTNENSVDKNTEAKQKPDTLEMTISNEEISTSQEYAEKESQNIEDEPNFVVQNIDDQILSYDKENSASASTESEPVEESDERKVKDDELKSKAASFWSSL
ncbi:hypothetical protein AAGG74_14750 [Bacillus mexicanus]|uniref:hypothetical protein n=1 Tax=Bacillus mexicanus TaxID=2834415 RepID=UPI003D23D16B